MDPTAVALKKLGERVLADDGRLPLALLLEFLVPVRTLRQLAQKYGLSPKGGFRLDRAPAKVVAEVLAEQKDARCLDEVLALLLPRGERVDGEGGAASAAAAASGERAPAEAPPTERTAPGGDLRARLALREGELARLRDELARAREGAARGRDREAMCQRQLQAATADAVRLQRALEQATRAAPSAASRDDRELQRRLHELESEREGFLATDEALRRQLASNQSRLRQLEEENKELEALLPKGRRRQRPPAPPPEAERRFRLPRFTASFYKSLEGKDRRSVERAVQAVLQFCTEGYAYPGLEVKQLGGQDTWSLRASLGLRVYFRPLADGDIELLELGDREDQHTTLRRLKER